jgi:hypothetical protein
MAVGVGTGLILGMWSFDGPMAVPEWLGAYDATSRRLVRLGHIAFLGLGILDVLVARELADLALGARMKRLAAGSMIFGNAFLPPALFAAGMHHPLKLLMPVPATAIFLSLALVTAGTWRRADRGSGDAAR